ncbi:hypothetical protein [Duganella sp. BJB488]|uniref:hypothetical protein n=1 Tax=Duganella sp. BJB488 TaxID=1871350 RepID=UPI001314C4F9|nr:hypothetical protein [Duganella sp. BJB488]
MISARRLYFLLSLIVASALVWKGVDLLTRPPVQAAPSSSLPSTAQQRGAALRETKAPTGHAAPDAPVEASVEEMVRDAAGDPEKSLAAFNKIEECRTLENDKELVDNTDLKITRENGGMQIQFVAHKADEKTLQALRRVCAGLTGRTRLDRFQLLEYAVDQHEAGALARYIYAGPQGDRHALKERPDDPAVIEWRRVALKRLDDSIAQGYLDALTLNTSGHLELGVAVGAPELYMEQLAVNKIVGAINSTEGPYPKEVFEGWIKSISAQQRADAEAQAERIFQAWKRRTTAPHATITPSATSQASR